MSISISTWNYLKFYAEAADLRVALEHIRSAGWGAELWLGWSIDARVFERSAWPRIRELCAGLPALSAHSALTQHFDLDTLYHEMDLCAHVGADPLVCHPRTFGVDIGTWAPRWDRRLSEEEVARIAEILRQASARSLRLALENGPPDLLAEVLERMADHPTRASLGICIDTGHANMHSRLYRSPAAEFIRRFSDRLIHVHVHDNHGAEDDHLMPGEGTTDWCDVFRELRRGGYAGSLVLELAKPAPELAAQQSVRFLQAYLTGRQPCPEPEE